MYVCIVFIIFLKAKYFFVRIFSDKAKKNKFGKIQGPQ